MMDAPEPITKAICSVSDNLAAFKTVLMRKLDDDLSNELTNIQYEATHTIPTFLGPCSTVELSSKGLRRLSFGLRYILQDDSVRGIRCLR